MASVKLSPDDLKQVEDIPAQPAPGSVKLSAADMQHVEDVPEDADEPGVLSRAWDVAKSVPGAVVDTVKSIGKGIHEAADVISPITSKGELHVPFSQLADGSYRREVERGISNVVTGGLATKAANAVSPEFAASEQADQKAAPDARNLGEVGGSFLPSPVNYAVGLGTKGAAAVGGKVGEAIGSAGRSDRRLLTKISTGAPKKLRDKLEQSEADAISTIRSNPGLEKAANSPHTLRPAVENHLARRAEQVDVHYAAADQSLGLASPAELADRLRARQAELRKKLSTRDVADGMEAEIKKLEAHGSELAGKAGDITKPRPGPAGSFDDIGEEVAFTPERRMAFQEEMRKAHGRELHGITDTETGGRVTPTSEQGTVAGGKGKPDKPATPVAKPESVPSEPAPGVDSRDLRQEITNLQEKAYSHAPWEKPGTEHKVAREVADTLRDALEERVGRVSPDALAEVKRLNQESAALAKLKAVAKYRDLNAPHELTTRLTAAMRKNRGAVATARAGVSYTFASADEALASLARAAKKGPVPKSMLRAARDAGIKAATVDFLTTKVGRQDDADEEADSN